MRCDIQNDGILILIGLFYTHHTYLSGIIFYTGNITFAAGIIPLAAARLYPLAAARLYRVAILNYLFVFPRDTIAREQGETCTDNLEVFNFYYQFIN